MKGGLGGDRLTGVSRGTGKSQSLGSVEVYRGTDGTLLLLDVSLLKGLLGVKGLLYDGLLGCLLGGLSRGRGCGLV